MDEVQGNQTAGANTTLTSTGKTEETTFAGSLLQWTGTGDWGIIASEIALRTVICMAVVNSLAGLILGVRYYQHALFKSRQRKDLGQNSGFSLATITYQAGAAAGVQIWMIGVAVSIPVIFTVVGLVVGFFMGITIGALLAGILIYSQVTVTPDMETAIGILISLVLIFFSVAPPSFTVNFL